MPLSNPLGFKHHPLEGAGRSYMIISPTTNIFCDLEPGQEGGISDDSFVFGSDFEHAQLQQNGHLPVSTWGMPMMALID